MKIHVDVTALSNRLKSIERESVTVGILNHSMKAASIDYNQGIKTETSADFQAGLDSQGLGSYERRYVKRKGRNKNISLRKLGQILNKKYGLFSDVLRNPNNRDLVAVAQLFAIPNKSLRDEKRLQNACIALIKNPILRRDYGRNSPYWTNKKGFDHLGIATGTFFKNIKARFKKW